MDQAALVKNRQKWVQFEKKIIPQQYSFNKITEYFNPASAEQIVKTWKGATVQHAKLGDVEIIKKTGGLIQWTNPFQKIRSYVIGLDSKATFFCGIKPLATNQYYRGCCYYENPKQKVYLIMGQQLISMISLQGGMMIDFRFYAKKKNTRQQRFHVRMDGKSSGFVQWGDKPKQKLQRKFTGAGEMRKAYYSIYGQKTETLTVQKSDQVIYHYLGVEKANQLSLLQYFWIVTGIMPFFFPFTLNNFIQFNHNSDRKHLQIRFRSSTLIENMFHQMYPNHSRCSPPFVSAKKYDTLSFQVFQENQKKRSKITQQQVYQRKQRYLTITRQQRQDQEFRQECQRYKALKTQYLTKQTIRFQKQSLQRMAKQTQNAFKKKTFNQAFQSLRDIKTQKQTQKIPQAYINLTKKTFNLQKQGIINQGMALYQPNMADQTFTMKDYTMNNSMINQTFGMNNPIVNQTFGMKDVTMNNISMNQTFILKDLSKNDISMNQSYGMHDYSRANISMNQTYNMRDISKGNILNQSKINDKWSLQKMYQQNKISRDLKQNILQNGNLKFQQNQKQLQEKKKLLRQQNIEQNLNDFPSIKQDVTQDDLYNPFLTFFSTLGINQQKGVHFHFMEKMSQTMIRIAMRYFLYISSYNPHIQISTRDFPTIFNDIVSNFLIINIQIDFILYPSLDHYLAIVYFFNRFQALDPQIPQLITTDLYQYYNKHWHQIQFQVSSENQQPSTQKIQIPQQIAKKNQIVSLIKKIDDNFTILQNCFFACSLRSRVNFQYSDIQNISMQIIKNCYMFFVSTAQFHEQISLMKRNKMLEFKKNRLLCIIQLVNVKILLLVTLSLVVMMLFQKRKDKSQIQIQRSRQNNSAIFHRLSSYVANLLLISRITAYNSKSLSNFIYQEANCILRDIDYIQINKKYFQFETFMRESNDPRISAVFVQGFQRRTNSVREIMSKLKKNGKKNIKLLQYIQKNLGRIKQKHHKAIDKALSKLQPKIKRHITNIIKPDLDSQVVQHIADILNEVNLNFSIDREKNLLGLTLSCKSVNYTNGLQLYKGNEKLNDFIFLCGRNLGIVLTNEEDTSRSDGLVNDFTYQNKQRLQKSKTQFLDRQRIKLNLLGFKQQNFQLTQQKQKNTIQQLFKQKSSKLLSQIQISRTQGSVENYLLNQANYIAFQQNQTIIKKVLVGVLTKSQFMQGTIMPQIKQISTQKLKQINLLDQTKFKIIKSQFGQQGTFYSIQKWMQGMLDYDLQISLISWEDIMDKMPKIMEIYTQLIRDVNNYMLDSKLDEAMQNRKIILRGLCSFFISMINKINQDKGDLFTYFFTNPFQKALQFQVTSPWIQSIFSAITQQYKSSNFGQQLTVKAISKQLNKKLQQQFQHIQQSNSQRFEKYQQTMKNIVKNLQQNAELLVDKILKMQQKQRNLIQQHNQYSNLAYFKDKDELQYKRQALNVICKTLQIKGNNMAQLTQALSIRQQQLYFSTEARLKLKNILQGFGQTFNQKWQQNLNNYIKTQQAVQIALKQQIAFKQQQLRMANMVDETQLLQARHRIQNLMAQGNQLTAKFQKLISANQVVIEQKNLIEKQNIQMKRSQKQHQQQVTRINEQNRNKFNALTQEMSSKKQQLKINIANLDTVNKDLNKAKREIDNLSQQIRNYQQMRQQFVKSTNAYQNWIDRLTKDYGLERVLNELNMSQIRAEKSIRDEIQQSKSVIQQMNDILQKVLERDQKYNKVVSQFSAFKTQRGQQINQHLRKITELENKVKQLNSSQEKLKKQRQNKQMDIKTKQLLTVKQEQAKKLTMEKNQLMKQLDKKAQQLVAMTQQKNQHIQKIKDELSKGLADQTKKKATQQYIDKKVKQYTDKIKNFQTKQKNKIQELLKKRTIESLFQAYQNIQQYLQVQKISKYQAESKKNIEQMALQDKDFRQLLDMLSQTVKKSQQNLDKKKISLKQSITKQLPEDLKKKVVQQFQKRINTQQNFINQTIAALKKEIQLRGKRKVGQIGKNQSQMRQIHDRIKKMTQNIYQVENKFIQAAKIALEQAKKKLSAKQKQSEDFKKLEQKVKQLKQIQKKHQKLLSQLKVDQAKLTFKLSQKQKQILINKVKKHVQDSLKDLYAKYFQALDSQISSQGGFQRSTKIMTQITKIIQSNPELAKKMNVQINIPLNVPPSSPPPPPVSRTVPPSSAPPPPPKASIPVHPLSGHQTQQIDKLKKNLLIQKKTSAILFQILVSLISKLKSSFKKLNQLGKRWEENANKAGNQGDKQKCLVIAKLYGMVSGKMKQMTELPDTIVGKYSAQDLHNQVKSHYDAIMSMDIDTLNMTTYLSSFGS